jgi:hypothetical protein
MGVHSRAEAGGRQSGLAIAGSVVNLTVPNAATVAEIFVETAEVRYTREGTAPSTTLGFIAYPGDVILCNSEDECQQISLIRGTATSATVDVEYFTDISG